MSWQSYAMGLIREGRVRTGLAIVRQHSRYEQRRFLVDSGLAFTAAELEGPGESIPTHVEPISKIARITKKGANV